MSDEIDWSLVTWEGNRRAQREDFQRLSFRERVLVLEEMERVAEALRGGARAPGPWTPTDEPRA